MVQLGLGQQVCTIEQLLAGQHFEHPPTNVTLSQAERVQEQGQQVKLSGF